MPDNAAPITRARRTDFATRQNESGEMILEGYFVVFDQPYYYWDDCEEVVRAGAFDNCDMSDVRALIDHVPHLVLGRNTAGTVTLTIDNVGLFGSIIVNPNDTDAVSLYARTQRGDVDQASFGFDERTVAYTDLPDGRTRREILDISKLWEISVCTFPAYEQTYVSARSKAQADMQRAAAAARKEKLKRRFRHHA